MRVVHKFIPVLFILFTFWMTGCNEEREMLDLSNPADIVSFQIGDRTGVINDTSQTIVVTLPAGTESLSGLVPVLPSLPVRKRIRFQAWRRISAIR